MVVAIVWGLVQIVRSSIADFDLKATGEYAPFGLPKALVQELDALNDYQLRSYARELLNSAGPTSLPETTIADQFRFLDRCDTASQKIGAWLTERYPTKLRELLRSAGILWIEVRNEGRKEVTGLELQSPNTGWYLLRRPGQEDQVAAFSSIVPLGSLKPGAQLNITVWTSYGAMSKWDEDRTRLLHANGTASIAFRRQLGGVFAWMADYSIALLFPAVALLTLLGFCICWAVGLARSASAQAQLPEAQSNGTVAPTTPPADDTSSSPP